MRRTLLFALAIFCLSPRVQAQFDDDDENPYAPGLVVTFQDSAKHSATRLAPFLAYHGETDARLADGEGGVVLTGFLRTGAAGEYRFHLYGEGDITLKVAGQVATARLVKGKWFDSVAKLPADYVPIEVSFRGQGFTACWSGPRFGVEPVPARALFHLKEKSPGNEFERGQSLARVLRCGNCHAGEDAARPAPALDQLHGRIAGTWLTEWLTRTHVASPTPRGEEPAAPRRMPSFGLTAGEASELAGWLQASHGKSLPAVKDTAAPKPKRGDPPFDAKLGEQLFVSRGCLACHTWNGLGAGGWHGGGDLSAVALKRPASYFREWLANPAKLNRDHRMPTFELSEGERYALSQFLAAQHPADAKPDFTPGPVKQPTLLAGTKLAGDFHCASCHRLPDRETLAPQFAMKLGAENDWSKSCMGEPDTAKHRPGYRLEERDAKALKRYYSERLHARAAMDGPTLLAESNCMSCHSRQGPREITPLLPPPLTDKLAAVGKRYPDLAANLGALAPPSLNSVGDKLTDVALTSAIARKGESHRPYLHVKMPRFPLSDSDLQTLTSHLVAADRVPVRSETPKPDASVAERYRVAGNRLVSGDGFGCTSCHKVGNVLPPPGPASARGPDLAMLGNRIRREWYDRWVRDPARIVPRMEMPALQIPVAGVLDDKLDHQIAAVWHVLNLPGFEPPPPAPVRILRHTGQKPKAEAIVITDAVRAGGTMFVKPFLIGLPNRHNVMLDLESGRLARWTVGDTARQLTKGKSWFWEAGGNAVLEPGIADSDITLIVKGQDIKPELRGQFLTEATQWITQSKAASVDYLLHFPDDRPTKVQRLISALPTGFVSSLRIETGSTVGAVRVKVLSPEIAKRAVRAGDGKSVRLAGNFHTTIEILAGSSAVFSADGTTIDITPENTLATLDLRYTTEMPVDTLAEVPSTPLELKPVPIEIAPGFEGYRLPLSSEYMPTGLAWKSNGNLLFSSLKGQVCEAQDTNADGFEDRVLLLADGLPAPYGVNTLNGSVIVSAKTGVYAVQSTYQAHIAHLLASGWGYTLDYHDWAVGLPRTKAGEYYIGIPCEQDKRSVAAAKHHSEILKLVPRKPTPDDPRLFSIETVTRGSRFPMGLALNRHEELFASDNQGNYTPFNEINHVRKGDHFGFINSLERGKLAPKVTPAAIDIPHPWMRSVNGITFLDTPDSAKTKAAFGPFEGHMVGCEFNGKRLVRLTLEKVNGEYQGAVYPLSIPPEDPTKGLLGPLVCAVSPRGELYVGGVWDSGWGGGNNVGEIVKVTMQPEKLPCGIREVRAQKDGFVIEFTKPVDRTLAAQVANYAIESYRREPTPAYGGPDLDRRTEKVARVEVSSDQRRVTITLPEMRPGYLYEFLLKSLAAGGGEFFPAEAHYTLRSVPK